MGGEEPEIKIVRAVASFGIEAATSVRASGTVATEIQLKDPEPLPDNHPTLALIGQVVSEFARLEHALDKGIWRLLGTHPPLGACMTAQTMGTGPRCHTLKALCSFHGILSKFKREIDIFGGELEKIGKIRNRMIHDPWFFYDSTNSTAQLRTMARSDLVYGYRPISDEDLKKEVAEIRKLLEKANALIERIVGELPPSFGTRG